MAGISSIRARNVFSDIVQVSDDVNSIQDIESTYKCIQLKDLCQEIDFSTVCVRGEVSSTRQSFLTKKGWTMKVLIRDNITSCDATEEGNSVAVFMRGSYVEECKKIKEKDILVILGAQLERSTEGSCHPFNVIADESNQNLKLWIIQHPGKGVCKVNSESVDPKNTDGLLVNKRTYSKSDGINKGSVLQQSNTLHVSEISSPSNRMTTKADEPPPTKRCKLLLQPASVTYTKLANLKVNSIVNVYGVVKFFKSAFKTKGLDFVCTLSLVDPSLDSLEQSFKCVLFSKSKETLPLVKSVGDIVRFHHLGVGQFKGELQGKFLPGSSWLVFDSENQDTQQPRSSSSKSFTLTDLDNDVITELRSWTTEKESLTTKGAATSLKDLCTSHTFVNLFCQVVSKSFTDAGNCVVLAVWDGTLPACQSFLVEPISEKGQIASDAPIPKAVGRSVDVFLYDNHAEGDTKRVCPGDFVRINNVHVKAIENEVSSDKSTESRPQVSLVVHKGTICGRGLEILPANDPVVTSSTTFKCISEAKVLLSTQQEQSNTAAKGNAARIGIGQTSDVDKTGNQKEVQASCGVRALQTSCTITEHPCIPFTSLKSIRTSNSVPCKFRCRVKAVMYLPNDVKQFVRQCCQSCRSMIPNSPVPASSNSPVPASSNSPVPTSSNSPVPASLNSPVPASSNSPVPASSNSPVPASSNSPVPASSSTDAQCASSVCPSCKQETSHVYLFSLILEDFSGLLHAMVFDKDVATFFPDLPPPGIFVSQTSFQENLRGLLVSMTQNTENLMDFVAHDSSPDNRPWMELCIMSYFSEDSRKVLYRVFDSVFVTNNQ